MTSGMKFSPVDSAIRIPMQTIWTIWAGTSAQQLRLMAHWRLVMPKQILTVRAENLVRDFADTLWRVLGFLDLPYDPNCEFSESIARGQITEAIGGWRASSSSWLR